MKLRDKVEEWVALNAVRRALGGVAPEARVRAIVAGLDSPQIGAGWKRLVGGVIGNYRRRQARAREKVAGQVRPDGRGRGAQ